MAVVGVRWAIVLGVALTACDASLPEPAPAAPAASVDGTREIQPLPDRVEGLDPARTKLGQLLFDERLLSADGTKNCAYCHPLQDAGTDRKIHSRGVKGDIWMNTPTIYNVGFNYRFNWRGQFATLEDELDAPMLLKAMGNKSWNDVVERLHNASGWDERFRAAGFGGVSEAAIKKAIATYERSLITPNSRFDRFLKGDQHAITADERAGFERFKELGCVACHQGRNVGGNMYQRIGVVTDYLSTRGIPLDKAEIDPDDPKHLRLRVPSLRNVACTAPYLHDGLHATLEETIQIMGRDQVGRRLSNTDVRQIKAFLITLTGQLPDGKPVCEEH